MAYTNFIPTVWAVGLDRALERKCVFAEDCNRKYEGKVKNKGDSVKINGVGKPTIYSIARDAANNDINAAEEIEDTSVILYINQIRYFNYMVGDIDKAQAQEGVMEDLAEETAEELANEVDKYIASFAVDPAVKQLHTTVPKVVAGTPSTGEINVMDVLDNAIQALQENDVPQSAKIVVTVTPRFFKLFKKEYIKSDTDNSEMLKNGKVAMYGNVVVKLSNNVHKTSSGAVDNIMIRTQRAIAYVKAFSKIKPYEPELKFGDAIKGLMLFDAKVVRPKEIININVKYA